MEDVVEDLDGEGAIKEAVVEEFVRVGLAVEHEGGGHVGRWVLFGDVLGKVVGIQDGEVQRGVAMVNEQLRASAGGSGDGEGLETSEPRARISEAVDGGEEEVVGAVKFNGPTEVIGMADDGHGWWLAGHLGNQIIGASA